MYYIIVASLFNSKKILRFCLDCDCPLRKLEVSKPNMPIGGTYSQYYIILI